MTGSTISHYRILSRLGKGGMGEVYEVEDTRLGRRVALKSLPEQSTTDRQALERFGREARTASSLNHPNICTIHDIGEQEGKPFIVMELLDGKTLRQEISGTPVGIAQLLELALQIIDALDAAHDAGIIHRDVKPGNIIVTARGQAKILDFGLAKLMPQRAITGAQSASPPETVSMLPEVALTSPGVAVGTVAYMSPEQARGEDLDPRTDLFSFGVVLYEMATGRRPFEGNTSAIVFDAILNQVPTAPVRLNPQLPLALEAIINKALEKDRDLRYQTASDMLADLKRVKRDNDSARSAATQSSSSAETVYAPRSVKTRAWKIAAMVLLTAVNVLFLLLYFVNPPKSKQPSPSQAHDIEVRDITGFALAEMHPAFSPDGNRIAFSAWGQEDERLDILDNLDVYVTQIDGGSPVRLTSDPKAEFAPAWSPTGNRLAYFRDLELSMWTHRKEIVIVRALDNRQPRKVHVTEHGQIWREGSLAWSPDGKYLAFSERRSQSEPFGIVLIDCEAHPPRNTLRLTSPIPTETRYGDHSAVFSPDRGKTVAFVRDGVGIYVIPSAGGEEKQVLSESANITGLAWTRSGREILFSSDRGGKATLWRVDRDGGQPTRVVGAGFHTRRTSVARQGSRLAYEELILRYQIFEIKRDKAGEYGPPRTFGNTSRSELEPWFSPDGEQVVFSRPGEGIWVRNTDGSGTAYPLTKKPKRATKPRWSPEGQQVAYEAWGQEDRWSAGIYVIGIDGSPPYKVSGERHALNPTWSRDGSWIYFNAYDEETGQRQLWKVPKEGGDIVRVTQNGGREAQEGPDGSLYIARGKGPGITKCDIDGGNEEPIAGLENTKWWCYVVVDKGIYYYDFEKRAILFFDFELGRVADNPVAKLGRDVDRLAVSPDGAHVLYNEQVLTGNIILLENFQ